MIRWQQFGAKFVAIVPRDGEPVWLDREPIALGEDLRGLVVGWLDVPDGGYVLMEAEAIDG